MTKANHIVKINHVVRVECEEVVTETGLGLLEETIIDSPDEEKAKRFFNYLKGVLTRVEEPDEEKFYSISVYYEKYLDDEPDWDEGDYITTRVTYDLEGAKAHFYQLVELVKKQLVEYQQQ